MHQSPHLQMKHGGKERCNSGRISIRTCTESLQHLLQAYPRLTWGVAVGEGMAAAEARAAAEVADLEKAGVHTPEQDGSSGVHMWANGPAAKAFSPCSPLPRMPPAPSMHPRLSSAPAALHSPLG